MLHVGLDLSRRRLDFAMLCEDGSRVERSDERRRARRGSRVGRERASASSSAALSPPLRFVRFDRCHAADRAPVSGPKGSPARSPVTSRSAVCPTAPIAPCWRSSCAVLATAALAACGGSGSGADNPSGSASNGANDSFRFAHGACANTAFRWKHRPRAGLCASPSEAPRRDRRRACTGWNRRRAPAGSTAPRPRPRRSSRRPKRSRRKKPSRSSPSACANTASTSKPRPRAAGGGFAVRIGIHRHAGEGGSENGPNPESPAFAAAQRACQGLMPRPPGAAKGGLSKGPPPGGGPKARKQSRFSTGG